MLCLVQAQRGQKRQREASAQAPVEDAEGIVKGRYDSLKTLVARCFAHLVSEVSLLSWHEEKTNSEHWSAAAAGVCGLERLQTVFRLHLEGRNGMMLLRGEC